MNEKRQAIMRPHSALPLITSREDQFFTQAQKLTNWEAESLRDQISQGVKPADLVLPIAAQKKLVAAMSDLLVQVGLIGVKTARGQIDRARLVNRFSAAKRIPDPSVEGGLHYPQAGVQWYHDYSLRLVGIHQTAVIDRVKDVVSDSVVRGEALDMTIRRMREVLTGLSKARLENIVRTETAKVYEQAKYQEYDAEPEVVGFEIVAILDERTTDICRSRDGKIIPKTQIEGNQPPYHFQCRTTVVPVFSWEAEAKGFEWQPVEDDAPRPMNGFGSTGMEIPNLTKPQARLVKQLRIPI